MRVRQTTRNPESRKCTDLAADGRRERFAAGKLARRAACALAGRDVLDVITTVQGQVCEGMSSAQLDRILAEALCAHAVVHPDYELAAGRVAATAIHRARSPSFCSVILSLPPGRIAPGLLRAVKVYGPHLDALLDHRRDLDLGYIALQRIERYLLKQRDDVVERPQHFFLRLALAHPFRALTEVAERYRLISRQVYIPSDGVLIRAGLGQCEGAHTVSMEDDSLEGIFNTVAATARVSPLGTGLSISNIRAEGTSIAGTGGRSSGVVPMLRVFNESVRAGDGRMRVYLEPWHADVLSFLDLRKAHGKDERRARALDYALWLPDLFMRRVEADLSWSLMSHDECPGLQAATGKAFEQLYCHYESAGRARRTLPARDVWSAILTTQMETCGPAIVYKDAVNQKSNESHLGTILGSTENTEGMQVADSSAVMVGGTISLPSFVNDGAVDYEALHATVKTVVTALDALVGASPLNRASENARARRALGLSLQGLADAFHILEIPFDSPEARAINCHVFETVYHAAVERSMELARRDGQCGGFDGSPLSRGLFQFDLWDAPALSKRYNWDRLRQEINRTGVRNTLLVAQGTGSNLLPWTPGVGPCSSNVMKHVLKQEEVQMVNADLVQALSALSLWNDGVRDRILSHGGSIKFLTEVPEWLKAVYRTAWEIPQRAVLDMAIERGVFICQSQSIAICLPRPTRGQMTSMHFYAWKRGLKTGCTTLSTQPPRSAAHVKPAVRGHPPTTLSARPASVRSRSSSSASSASHSTHNTTAPPPEAACALDESCLMCSG